MKQEKLPSELKENDQEFNLKKEHPSTNDQKTISKNIEVKENNNSIWHQCDWDSWHPDNS